MKLAGRIFLSGRFEVQTRAYLRGEAPSPFDAHETSCLYVLAALYPGLRRSGTSVQEFSKLHPGSAPELFFHGVDLRLGSIYSPFRGDATNRVVPA